MALIVTGNFSVHCAVLAGRANDNYDVVKWPAREFQLRGFAVDN